LKTRNLSAGKKAFGVIGTLMTMRMKDDICFMVNHKEPEERSNFTRSCESLLKEVEGTSTS